MSWRRSGLLLWLAWLGWCLIGSRSTFPALTMWPVELWVIAGYLTGCYRRWRWGERRRCGGLGWPALCWQVISVTWFWIYYRGEWQFYGPGQAVSKSHQSKRAARLM